MQLSYGATLGIILFGQGQNNNYIIKKSSPDFGGPSFYRANNLFYFKQVSLISPLANLLVAETIPPPYGFGFLTAILGRLIIFWVIFPV